MIGMEWAEAVTFSQGLAVVGSGNMSSMINTQGNLVIEIQWGCPLKETVWHAFLKTNDLLLSLKE